MDDWIRKMAVIWSEFLTKLTKFSRDKAGNFHLYPIGPSCSVQTEIQQSFFIFCTHSTWVQVKYCTHVKICKLWNIYNAWRHNLTHFEGEMTQKLQLFIIGWHAITLNRIFQLWRTFIGEFLPFSVLVHPKELLTRHSRKMKKSLINYLLSLHGLDWNKISGFLLFPSLDSLVKWAGVSLVSWLVFMVGEGKRGLCFSFLLFLGFRQQGKWMEPSRSPPN